MILANDTSLLFIEPLAPPSSLPVIDKLTKKMTAAYHVSEAGFLRQGQVMHIRTLGFHTCSCGASSDNTNHVLPDMSMETTSLCIHYLAIHREEVPQSELDKVMKLNYGLEEPSDIEIFGKRLS